MLLFFLFLSCLLYYDIFTQPVLFLTLMFPMLFKCAIDPVNKFLSFSMYRVLYHYNSTSICTNPELLLIPVQSCLLQCPDQWEQRNLHKFTLLQNQNILTVTELTPTIHRIPEKPLPRKMKRWCCTNFICCCMWAHKELFCWLL